MYKRRRHLIQDLRFSSWRKSELSKLCISKAIDEILTRQCSCLRAFDSCEERVGSGELDSGWITDRGTRSFTQVHVPSAEDRYILLAIYYMSIVVLQRAVGGGWIFIAYNVISMRCVSRGALGDFICAAN
jgi:hypothetical protein